MSGQVNRLTAPVALLALGGIAVAAFSYTVAGNRILSQSSVVDAGEMILEVPEIGELDLGSEIVAETVVPVIRPVAPDILGAPIIEPGQFERVEDRDPLSPMGRATDPRDLPPQPTVLHRPVVTAAGSFEAQGHKVVLGGIEVTDPQQQCGDSGKQWPCGIHARTAFRTWLRGRALSCVVTPVPVQEAVVSDCTLGTHNPAEWLVSQGWVRAAADGPYAKLGAQAEKERRGLFGPAPDSSIPSTALPQVQSGN